MASDPLLETEFDEQFIIKERVKPGGMAIVYRAFDKERQVDVALKILQDNLAIYDEVVSRFEQEAQITETLEHPNIVRFFKAGNFQGKLYIAMEYMPGGSLADYITLYPEITLGRTVEILTQVGTALDYAHKQNIVHRDLKLGNILLDAANRAMLTDFGIARLLDHTNLTQTGQPMPGTVKYMSPEQAHGANNQLDARSDLYSFAVIAYLLSVGRYPFTGVNDIIIINQHINMTPPPPSQINPALPPELDDVLYKGMAKLAEDRYPTVGEFVTAFKDAVVGHETVVVTVNMRADNPGLRNTPTNPSGQGLFEGARSIAASGDGGGGGNNGGGLPGTRPISASSDGSRPVPFMNLDSPALRGSQRMQYVIGGGTLLVLVLFAILFSVAQGNARAAEATATVVAAIATGTFQAQLEATNEAGTQTALDVASTQTSAALMTVTQAAALALAATQDALNTQAAQTSEAIATITGEAAFNLTATEQELRVITGVAATRLADEATATATAATAIRATAIASMSVVPTNTSTYTPTATPTDTPTPTRTATSTATLRATLTATVSPTATLTPTITLTPTPNYGSLDAVIDEMVALSNTIWRDFDCAALVNTVDYLQARIDAGDAQYLSAESLLSERSDLFDVYEFCDLHRDETRVDITVERLDKLRRALSDFEQERQPNSP